MCLSGVSDLWGDEDMLVSEYQSGRDVLMRLELVAVPNKEIHFEPAVRG